MKGNIKQEYKKQQISFKYSFQPFLSYRLLYLNALTKLYSSNSDCVNSFRTKPWIVACEFTSKALFILLTWGSQISCFAFALDGLQTRQPYMRILDLHHSGWTLIPLKFSFNSRWNYTYSTCSINLFINTGLVKSLLNPWSLNVVFLWALHIYIYKTSKLFWT